MEPLIKERSFFAAAAFGARVIPLVITNAWPVFAVLIVAYGSVLLFATSLKVAFDVASGAVWIAQFPAIAVVVRMVRPRFRMTPQTIFGLVLASLPSNVATTVSTSVVSPAHRHFDPIDVLLILGVALLTSWLGVKLDAAPVLGALQNDGKDVVASLATSWRIVAGGMWWRLWALNVLVYIVCVVPFVVADRFVPALFRHAPTPEIANALQSAFDLIAFSALLVSVVWYESALVGLMSAPDDAEGPTLIEASETM